MNKRGVMAGPVVVALDDEPKILDSLRRIFLLEDIEIFCTGDPARAHEAIASGSVKVVISDQRMPAVSGVVFLTGIKNSFPLVQRILLTGYADMQAAQDAVNSAGVYRFLSKPWNDHDLVLTVKEAIRHYDLQAENVRLQTVTQSQLADLQELDRLKSEFIANVSHELRTPVSCLNMIFSNINAGIAGDVSVLPDKMRSYLKKAEVNLENLKNMINDLLDTFKLSDTSFKLSVASTDLAYVFRAEIEAMKVAVEAKKLTIVYQGSAACVCVCDEVRIAQVLRNLLSNALKFTERGGVTVDLKHAGDNIMFSVTDTGMGITPQAQQYIFDRFRQVKEMAQGKPSGTGLGLSICRTIMELHGGTVSVTSEPGTGSTFTCTMPKNV
jgi:signal transduction histidine kinase